MATTAKWSDLSSLDGEHLLAVLNERLPRWITLLLVAAIAWQLARVVWMLMPGPSSGTPIIAPPEQVASRAPGAGQPNVSAISSAHLFGIAKARDVAAEQPKSAVNDVDALPDARVAFSVKGIMAASDPSYSVAILANQGKEENVYMIGAMIQPGTTLEEIHTHLIVIRQNGALYKLELPKDFPESTPSIARSAPAVSRDISSNTQSIQNVVAQNVTKLADVIRPTPYFANGEQQGYRVYPGRDRKQFAALGLRPGDLIKDIDGAALTDPAQALQIFENLGNAEEVSVTIERNGQPQTLILQTSQLDLDEES